MGKIAYRSIPETGKRLPPLDSLIKIAHFFNVSLDYLVFGHKENIPFDDSTDQFNRELMAEVFPGVPLREGVGDHDTLLSVDKARRLLGYAPAYSWRSHQEK